MAGGRDSQVAGLWPLHGCRAIVVGRSLRQGPRPGGRTRSGKMYPKPVHKDWEILHKTQFSALWEKKKSATPSLHSYMAAAAL